MHELIAVWPRDTRFAQRCFELLRQAYVNARYSAHYKVTPAELEWLAERVELLQQIVKEPAKSGSRRPDLRQPALASSAKARRPRRVQISR